jgi:ADP-ribosylglycohydrolase
MNMLGAIVGDIVGSVYEFNNLRTKNFPLFTEESSFTDDTILTIAVADVLLSGGATQKHSSAITSRHLQDLKPLLKGDFSNLHCNPAWLLFTRIRGFEPLIN